MSDMLQLVAAKHQSFWVNRRINVINHDKQTRLLEKSSNELAAQRSHFSFTPGFN